jgi:hypothetical protein
MLKQVVCRLNAMFNYVAWLSHRLYKYPLARTFLYFAREPVLLELSLLLLLSFIRIFISENNNSISNNPC